jgi:ABC-type transport system involved in cytochrome bd biosynthesis fused ATPase/permease subunit
MLTYVHLLQIFKLYQRNWYILAVLLTGATVFGTSMGMLTVSSHHLVGTGPIPLAYSKLK